MRLFRKLAVLATAADAIRRFAKNNPEQFNKVVEKAAGFVDQRTKGKYSTQIGGVTRKVRDMTGANGASSSTVSQPASQQRS